jgi:hypothetical protein
MGGNSNQEISVKAKLVNLIGAVRTLMRGAYCTVKVDTYIQEEKANQTSSS